MFEKRRAQVTLLIIVAMIIFGGIIAGFYFISSNIDEGSGGQKTSTEYQNIKACLEDVVVNGIYYTSLQGGYAVSPSKSESYQMLQIPVFWEENKSYQISLDDIEVQMEEFVAVNAETCFNQDVNLDGKVIVEFENNRLFLELDAPLYFESSNEKIVVDEFKQSVPVRMNDVYNLTSRFIEYQGYDPFYLPLTFLNTEAVNNGLRYEIVEFDYSTKMISIIMDPLDERGPVVYNFIVKYEEI